MNPRFPAVASRALHRCEYCRAPESVFNFPFEVEHIIPPIEGAGHDDQNLALACRACNVRKGIHVTMVNPESEMETPLFHPRNDRWDEHFAVDVATGLIHGLTPAGRGTVTCLEMNSEPQLSARRFWMQLGLFP